MTSAINAVRSECARQESLKAAGRFEHTCRDAELSDSARAVVLMEEVGEVARAVLEGAEVVNDTHDVDLRKELIQVAAVCVSWVDGMDERQRAKEHEEWLVAKTKERAERKRQRGELVAKSSAGVRVVSPEDRGASLVRGAGSRERAHGDTESFGGSDFD